MLIPIGDSPAGMDGNDFDCWPLEPLYLVKWTETEVTVIITKPDPGPGPKDDPKKTWIEIRLVDANGDPIPDEEFILHCPDGTAKKGKLDPKGRKRYEGVEPGEYTVSFPDIGYTIPVSV